jgi:hypothetical protein
MKPRSVEKIIFIREGRNKLETVKSPKNITLVEQDFLRGKFLQEKVNGEFEKSKIYDQSNPSNPSNPSRPRRHVCALAHHRAPLLDGCV